MQVVTTRPESGRKRVQTVFEDESLTVQSDRQRGELRSILAKYEQTGVLVSMRDVDLAFRDVSEFSDFTDVMRASKDAEAAFLRLPSKVREVFNHNVSEWLDCAHDAEKLESKRPELVKLGVLEELELPPEPKAPSPPPVGE